MAEIKEFEWYRRVKKSEDYFKQESVLEKIYNGSVASAKFIRENKGSYTATALLEPNKPWWPNVKHTNSPIILETRGMNMRWRVWEHGSFDLLRNLEKDLDFNFDSLIGLIDGTTFAVAMNLIAREHANGPTMSLAQFSALYGYSEGSGNDKARDSKLVPLVEIGLFNARFKGQWAISIGPVGKAFFDNVYFPLIHNFDINPSEQED